MDDYYDLVDMLASMYEEVAGVDFYNYIFPDNENQGELNQDYSKPNAIYLYQNEEEKMKRRVMLNDTWEDDYLEYVLDNKSTLCSGLTYRGRANKLDKAQRMNALIFDLDSVGIDELRNNKALSRKQLSIISGVPETTIHDIEKGITDNPRIKTVQAIAKALNVDINEII